MGFPWPIHILVKVYISCLSQILTIIRIYYKLVQLIKKTAQKIWYAIIVNLEKFI